VAGNQKETLLKKESWAKENQGFTEGKEKMLRALWGVVYSNYFTVPTWGGTNGVG